MRDITDTVGVRVITYFNDDVDKIAKVIEREFEVDRENSIDKRVTDPDRFGYSSLHYVVNFNADRVKFIEYKDFKEVKFEIQIRSILQHAWAEIEHDLGYKSKNEVPKEIRRDFSRIAGLLEIADNEFMRIKNFLDNYSRVMGTKIRDLDLNVPIDKVTLMEYVATSQVVKEILIKMCSAIGIDHSRIEEKLFLPEQLIDNLHSFDIRTIAQLDVLLDENKNQVPVFIKAYNPQINSNSLIGYDLVFVNLFYLIIYRDFSEERLTELLINYQLKNEQDIKEIIKKFRKFLEEEIEI
ncbi:hypothetical protein ABE073_15195 [Lederbergia citrisecunda]|uniref:GTP pyrophosphokinase n=2 Tax=Bacillales TaxID=1385 RepID=UPI003D286A36